MIKILPHRGVRGPSLRAFALLVFVLAVTGNGNLAAQITKVLQPAVVVRNARLLTMDGKVIENGTIVCQGGRITAIGTSPALPLLRRDIDASGKTITPGFIDVSSALGRTESAASGGPLRQAEDAFDHYAVNRLREALRNGVTSAYVSVGEGTGIRGRGAVIRLETQKGGTIGSILAPRAALEIDLGSALAPLARINVFNSVHRQLQAARAYRESLEDYEDKLEEYKKKLTERAAAKKREGDGENKKKKDRPQRTADFAAREKTDAKPGQAPKGKDDAPKKPRKPRRNPSSERLLEALDRELPVRVTANKSADILNALDLAKEFDFDLILEGASEAHLVANTIPSEVSIILSGLPRAEVPSIERTTPRNGMVLRSIGSHRVVVGSGARSQLDARFVAFLAQLDAAPGGNASDQDLSSADRLDILERVTSDAADILGVGGEIGRLRKGMRADFVIWSGDPLDPASQVENVFVGGTEAYDADERGAE